MYIKCGVLWPPALLSLSKAHREVCSVVRVNRAILGIHVVNRPTGRYVVGPVPSNDWRLRISVGKKYPFPKSAHFVRNFK